MKLLDLVVHLAERRPLDSLFLEQGVDPAAEPLTVYLRDGLVREADIALLGEEETGGLIDYHQDGKHWVYCLELDLVEEFVEEGLAQQMSPTEIAARVLHYALYDA